MSIFTFRTVKNNPVNWTEHSRFGFICEDLVVLERASGSWYLLRKQAGKPEQRIPLRSVPDRVKNEVTWYGRVYLNNRTGKVSQFQTDSCLRDGYQAPSRPRPRRSSASNADAAFVGALIGAAVGVALKD